MSSPALQKYPKEYLNAFLIRKGVRQAFLFQTIDYDEYNPTDPKSAERLSMIKAEFPELVQTPMNQGVLISRQPVNKKQYSTNARLAGLLGYPCVIVKNMRYGYDIYVTINGTRLTLFSYRCVEKTTEASNAIKDKVKAALSELGLTDVGMIEEYSITATEIAEKLEKNQTLSKSEIDELINYLENFGFSQTNVMADLYEPENPLHNGMMIALMKLFDNHPLDVFYPLQDHPEEFDEVTKKTVELEAALIASLQATKRRTGSSRKHTRRQRVR